jgi:hypothetical protein
MEKLLQTVALNYDLKDVLLGNPATEITSCFHSHKTFSFPLLTKVFFEKFSISFSLLIFDKSFKPMQVKNTTSCQFLALNPLAKPDYFIRYFQFTITVSFDIYWLDTLVLGKNPRLLKCYNQ